MKRDEGHWHLSGYASTIKALQKLKPGEVYVYHQGEMQDRSPGVWKAAAAAADQGLVTIHCRRRPDGVLERIAIGARA